MSSNKKVQLIFEWEIVYVYILPAAHRKVVSLNKKELLNLSSGDSIKQYSLLDRVNVLLLSFPPKNPDPSRSSRIDAIPSPKWDFMRNPGFLGHIVDGRNPANHLGSINPYNGIHYQPQLVQDFSHQQYKQILTWRIIPFSKWLKTMISKSPKWGYSPSKWPKWLILWGY